MVIKFLWRASGCNYWLELLSFFRLTRQLWQICRSPPVFPVFAAHWETILKPWQCSSAPQLLRLQSLCHFLPHYQHGLCAKWSIPAYSLSSGRHCISNNAKETSVCLSDTNIQHSYGDKWCENHPILLPSSVHIQTSFRLQTKQTFLIKRQCFRIDFFCFSAPRGVKKLCSAADQLDLTGS